MNPHCLPPDPAGNRRFVVLTVRGGADGAAGVRLYLKNFREQLWAEALYRYREGEPAHLPADLARAQAVANSGAVQVDETLEDALLGYIDGLADGERFRVMDVRRSLRPRFGEGMPSDKRLSVELQRLECEYVGQGRVKGQRGRWWHAPVPF